MAIARQAVTLLKNDGVLPITGGRVVILGRTATDNTPISYALALLRQGGFIDPDIRIENRITGETTGGEDASTVVVIDRYYNDGELAYTDDLTEAIVSADAVVCLSNAGEGLDRLQDDNPQILGVRRALLDAREGGARFVLLSDNLPVDTTRFQDADAIVCAFMSSGSGVDPMAPTGASGTVGAFNANIPAALCAIFGDGDMPGRLPINIPTRSCTNAGRAVKSIPHNTAVRLAVLFRHPSYAFLNFIASKPSKPARAPDVKFTCQLTALTMRCFCSAYTPSVTLRVPAPSGREPFGVRMWFTGSRSGPLPEGAGWP